MVKFASPSCVCFVSFGFLLATICVWVWIVCSLHSVTTGSRDRANVSLIIIQETEENNVLRKRMFWTGREHLFGARNCHLTRTFRLNCGCSEDLDTVRLPVNCG